MKLAPTLALIFVGVGLAAPSAALGADTLQTRQQQWALAGGPAVKIVVRRDGWYRVSRQRLLAAGLGRTTPVKRLRLFADGREVPIRVRRDRSIEFFGVRRYIPTTDARIYWLVAGSEGEAGKRMRRAAVGRKGKSLRTFVTTVQSRPRNVYYPFLKQGPEDNFFGPSVTPGKPATQTISVPAPAPGANPSLSVGIQGISLLQHEVSVSFNGQRVGSSSFAGRVPGTIDARLPDGLLKAGDNTVSVSTDGGELDFVLLWRIRVTYTRLLAATGDRLAFALPAKRRATVTGFSGHGVRVFDISRPYDPRPVRVATRRGVSDYSVSIGAGPKFRRLLAVGPQAVLEPAAVVAERPSNWHRPNQGADYVIVTHANFIPSLSPLVQLRQAQGLSVKVVDVEDVYDEFDYGIHGANAIRRFLAHAYEAWTPRPRFALLFGDGTYDPQNYLGLGQGDFVPTKTVDTATSRVPSDDWMVDFDDNGVPEIAVGRLAVGSAAGADQVVAKVVSYETQALGPSRPALFVSDSDPRVPLEASADRLQQLIPGTMPVERRYRRDAASREEFRTSLIAAFESGPALVSYVGHGGPEVWGREGLFFPGDADKLTNANRLSIYVATSCLSGAFYVPERDSLGEALVETPNGGAVAVLTSAGTETLEAGELLHRGFLSSLFGPERPTIGEATVAAKRATGVDPNLAKVLILLGDPATRLR